MVRIIKKSDLSPLLFFLLIFTVFFLLRPVSQYFRGAESDWLGPLRGIAAILIILLTVYFAVICLRIRDRWREVAHPKTSRDE